METFVRGERVRFVEKGYEDEGWTGAEGVVTDHFCDYGEHRVAVRFDGEDRVWELREESFEHIKETYTIKNESEDYAIAVMELTDSEAALIEKLVAELDRDVVSSMQPRLTIKKEKK